MLKISKRCVVPARVAGALSGCLLAVSSVGAPAQQPAWTPQKNVELVVPVGAGGSLDTTAREIHRIWQEGRMVEATSAVVNKAGGGHVIAYGYIGQHAGDAHYLSIASPTLLTNFITGKDKLRYTDVTPIAMLFSEYLIFTVLPDSVYKSGKDVLDAARKDPQSVSFAVASALGGANHINLGLALKGAGVPIQKLKVVVFPSSGASRTAMLGGHVDVDVTAASNAVAMLQQGKLRVLAVAAPARLAGPMADAPTWKELGVDAVFPNFRMVIAPRGLTPQQVAYWEGVLRRVTQTGEWKASLPKRLWVDQYLDSAATTRMLEQEEGKARGVLSDLGLAKAAP